MFQAGLDRNYSCVLEKGGIAEPVKLNVSPKHSEMHFHPMCQQSFTGLG